MLGEHYVQRRPALLALLRRMVRNPQAAEDLAQEAYLRVSRALERGAITHLDAFLHQTARNLARDHERQRLRRARFEVGDADDAAIDAVAAEDPAAETRILDREREAALRRILDDLPPRARAAWQMCYVDGQSYAQIARTLGVSRNTVYNDVKFCIGHCHDALRRIDRG